MMFAYWVGDDLASLDATEKRGRVRAYKLLKRTVLGRHPLATAMLTFVTI